MRNDEGRERTYGIWGFVAAFVAACVVGIASLLFVGNPNSSTIQVPTSQTMPATVPGTADATAPEVAGPTTGDAPEPSLPPGVAQVLVEGDTTSYLFDAPSGVDPSTLEPVVAPLGVDVAQDGRTATLTVGCARSSDELLAQVLISESPQSVTFVAVAVAPVQGAACRTDVPGRTVGIELPHRIEGRVVVVVPVGTAVPPLAT